MSVILNPQAAEAAASLQECAPTRRGGCQVWGTTQTLDEYRASVAAHLRCCGVDAGAASVKAQGEYVTICYRHGRPAAKVANAIAVRR